MTQAPTLSGLYTRVLSLEAHQGKLVDTPTIDSLITNLTTKFNTLSTTEGGQGTTLRLLSDRFADLKDLYVTHQATFLIHTGNPAGHHVVGSVIGLSTGDFILHTGFSHHHTQPDILTKEDLSIHTGTRGAHHVPYWAGTLIDDQILSGGFVRLRHEQLILSDDNDFAPKTDAEIEFLVAGTYYISSIANFVHTGIGGDPEMAVGSYWAEVGVDLGQSDVITGSQAYTWMSGGTHNNATINCVHTFAVGEQLKIKAASIVTFNKNIILSAGSSSLFVYRLGP